MLCVFCKKPVSAKDKYHLHEGSVKHFNCGPSDWVDPGECVGLIREDRPTPKYDIVSVEFPVGVRRDGANPDKDIGITKQDSLTGRYFAKDQTESEVEEPNPDAVPVRSVVTRERGSQ